MKVYATDLMLGMYVCRLDRPWLETPFLMQGFYLDDEDDLRKVREHCRHVYIDTEPHDSTKRKAKSPAQALPIEKAADKRADPSLFVPEFTARSGLKKRQQIYPDTTTFAEEIEAAKEIKQELAVATTAFIDGVRSAKKMDISAAKVAVGKMTESILRNPDAFEWLRLLKGKDNYTYSHCWDASALAIAFGRHLGLSKAKLNELAMGALMFDIGKIRVSQEILNKPGPLTPEEFTEVKRHVEHSIEIMASTKNLSDGAIAIAAVHHERHDGSGYPRGFRRTQIPVEGRIAGIVDCYDAITCDRPHASAISPHQAIRKLYAWRDTMFQAELVEQFIQSIGVYPVGAIVELSSGEVGIIISQNRVRRLRPTVLLVLDKHKTFYAEPPIIDLKDVPEDELGNNFEIVATLNPGSYGIDRNQYFL